MTSTALLRTLIVSTVCALITDASAQCSAISSAPPLPLHAPAGFEMRSGGPAQFVIPTLVHVYYTNIFSSVSAQSIASLIDETNLYLRGNNGDTTDVASPFRDIIGDLSVELRLAHIDEDGNCTSGIDYFWWNGQTPTPDVSASTQNTASYLNIWVYVNTNSYSTIPSPGQPVAGDPSDGIQLATYDALYRPRILAHEVGHWVGLFHTFGQTNSSGENCGDDGVADTPITKGSVVGTCDTTLSICTAGVVENVDNFMDYSTCYKMFTQGQQARVAVVMTDNTIARYMHCTPQNLAATGVDMPSTCPLMADFQTSTSMSCGTETVRFMSMVTGQIPDQLTWNFPGGSPATSTDEEPIVTYTTDGTYTAQLIACDGADCDTIEHDITIGPLYTLQSNGLSLASTPYAEDFEGGFAFPQPDMAVLEDGTPNWQVCDFAGYNSGHCLYMAGEAAPAVDTNEVIIGNFDLSGLAVPAISMKVAATYYPGVQFYYFNLMMRDLCDAGLQAGPWLTVMQLDLAGSNTNAGFVPTTPGQWNTVSYTNAGWPNYPNAEFMLRAVKPWMPGTVDEGLYVDDINIGEAEVVLGGHDRSRDVIEVFPDPATDHVTIIAGTANALLSIVDMEGREVYHANRTGRTDLDVSQWTPGAYMISLRTDDRIMHARLVVE
jgi:PKD repeat protein